MKKIVFGVLGVAAMLALAAPQAAWAGDPDGVPAIGADAPPVMDGQGPGGFEGRRGEMREKLKHMTPEEREAFHAKMKAKFDSLPPEKQAEIKAKMEERRARHGEMREKMKDMSPEERAEMKKKWMEEHGGRGGHHRRRGSTITHGQSSDEPITTR